MGRTRAEREGAAQSRALKAQARAERESRCRKLFAEGMRYCEIAARLGVDQNTVRRAVLGVKQ